MEEYLMINSNIISRGICYECNDSFYYEVEADDLDTFEIHCSQECFDKYYGN
jgi:hypothetical protein